MRKGRLQLPGVIALVLYLLAGETQAQWHTIIGSLQKEVHIVKETAERIVLYHPAHEVLLVITAAKEADSDIYAGLEVRRGGNPYRVWILTETYLQKLPERRELGDLFFRHGFVKSLKPEEAYENFAPSPEMKIESEPVDSIIARISNPPLAPRDVLVESAELVAAAVESTATPATENILVSTPVRPSREKSQTATPEEQPRIGLGKIDHQLQSLAQTASPRESASAAPERNSVEAATPSPNPPAGNDKKFTPAQRQPRNVMVWPSFGDKAATVLYFAGGLLAMLVLPMLVLVVFSPVFRARLCFLRDDFETAVRIYERALQRHPARVKLNAGLADLYLLLGRTDAKAMQVYKTVLRFDLRVSHLEKINTLVTQHLLAEGRADPDALEILEKALNSELLRQNRPGKK